MACFEVHFTVLFPVYRIKQTKRDMSWLRMLGTLHNQVNT